MFGPKMGSWWVNSEIDSRWNKNGRAPGLACEGGPDEMHQWIDYCKLKYGDPPKDAEMGFMKD